MSDAATTLDQPQPLFLDTSIFVGDNFEFHGPIFAALAARAKAGDIELVIPEVTRREVCARCPSRSASI